MPVAATSSDGLNLSIPLVCISQTYFQERCLQGVNDAAQRRAYKARMAHSRPKRYTNWFLRDWMAALNVTQAQLIEATGYSKTAVSLLCDDRQDYRPDIIRDFASALNIQNYELLMHPADAMALRRQRESALQLVETTKKLQSDEQQTVVPLKRVSGEN